MHNIARASLFVLAVSLAGCGSEPAAEPMEQIVVKEPSVLATLPGAGETRDNAISEDAPAAEGDNMITDGKAAFAQCAVCHTIDKGGPTRIGPNLHGVVGRKAASVAGFQYSSAMKSSGITWTDAELDAFIAGPLKKIPGTKMASAGIPDAAKRAAVIAYMKDASAN
ncbi:Cytochrome c2 [hydrothermal vent metagenome]|uniref:Cytochrome c2 n=1 Tax=hydrothermal vent metagenome TaxID=652676 RepID=A0A3B0R7U1_9ZZZZ